MERRIQDLQAVLLCGGKGERLRPLTNSLPKPLVPIHGRPILSYLISHLAHFGVRDLVVAAGYRADAIRKYFDSNHRELKVTVVDSGVEVDILQRVQDCRKHLRDDFLVCYGDTLANVDIQSLFDFHQQHRGHVTVTGYPLKSQFGLMRFGPNHKVTDFAEKPTLDQLINIGYYYFDQQAAKLLDHSKRFEDFLTGQVREGQFFGFKHTGLHITVNTLQELSDAEENVGAFEY
jgi:glucose-1-phosphate cytidylyltransferase